jgi:hypothetical protein
MMKTTFAVLLAIASAGCASTQRESFLDELRSAQIYGFPLLRPPPCTCSLTIDEHLSSLTGKANAILGPGREIHLVFVRRTRDLGPPPETDDSLVAVGPCPVHSTNTNTTVYFGQTYVSVWTRIELIAKITGLAVGIDPDSRTVILYARGQQDESTGPSGAAPNASFDAR